MSDSFDPYHKWLGIPPSEQPPDHYRLLGLRRFEDDADVIENAADGRMIHLKNYQSGERGKLTQQLLTEISVARICLLDPSQRDGYDQRLRQRLPPESEPLHPLPEAPVLKPATPPVVAEAREQALPHSVTREQFFATEKLAPKPPPRYPSPTVDWPWIRPVLIGLLCSAGLLGGIGFLVLVNRAINRTTASTSGQSEPEMLNQSPEHDGSATEGEPTDTVQRDPVANGVNPRNEGEAVGGEEGTRGAQLAVSGMIAVDFGHLELLPDSPETAVSFRWDPKPAAVDVRYGVLRFSVIGSGLVYLVTNTKYEGNRSGGWWNERLTVQQLEQRGWTVVGQCPWRGNETLLKRVVKEGETYQIRTNKYGPPQLIVPRPSSD